MMHSLVPTYNQAMPPSPALALEERNASPPPSYYASMADPPPFYEETDSNPVSLMPIIRTSDVIIHQPTFVTVRQQQQQQQQQVVVAPQPGSSETDSMGGLVNTPGRVRCPHCRTDVTTKVKQRPGRRAYTLCCVLTFSGLICGFCLIPFMIGDFWDVHHYCSQCGQRLYVYHKS
ncbi:lipopolysaccharide-induced tumor necrosis factor-alpha factor homolog [Nerophis ophidion]|uniref:lipopolysaccharide-induced tumor necrosis factor-alpha factor homolog n=1 Tax=Nerophis ophidion TaxID=159077 RepID=UPI002ADFB1A1|nr:lipopolysaccharide-induced tumor necrosis factor-alpha factor homolog [Nerophis ophidion]